MGGTLLGTPELAQEGMDRAALGSRAGLAASPSAAGTAASLAVLALLPRPSFGEGRWLHPAPGGPGAHLPPCRLPCVAASGPVLQETSSSSQGSSELPTLPLRGAESRPSLAAHPPLPPPQLLLALPLVSDPDHQVYVLPQAGGAGAEGNQVLFASDCFTPRRGRARDIVLMDPAVPPALPVWGDTAWCSSEKPLQGSEEETNFFLSSDGLWMNPQNHSRAHKRTRGHFGLPC